MSLARRRLPLLAAALGLTALLGAPPAVAQQPQRPIIGLITKTNTNPFFVKMREGAEARARELGLELRSFAGRVDGDNQTQVEAIESLISAGARGILITPSDSRAIVPAVERARRAGMLVIALDTPLEPANAADATFATDNFRAGELVGAWARAALGDRARDARIALLNLSTSGISVDVARNQGFLRGFGIDLGNPARMGDERDPRIVGQDVTAGSEEGGRRAMENLLQRDPRINVVYTINEPAAAGAYEALRAVGRDRGVLVVSVDGGCPGVRNVRSGVIGATSMQFPLLMASRGVEAVAEFARSGTRPQPTPGLDFVNTGVELVTTRPMEGQPAMGVEEALRRCWG
jgi:fructose transport system substrate-binding protein